MNAALVVEETSGTRMRPSSIRLFGLFLLAVFIHLLLLSLIPSRQGATWYLPAWSPDHALRVELAPQNVPETPYTEAMPASTALQGARKKTGRPVRDGLGVMPTPSEQSALPQENASSAPAAVSDPGAGADDLEDLKAQAVKIASDRSVTQDLPYDRLMHAPNAKEKFRDAVDKARREDCRTAYAGGGILAIPLLVENTLTGTGCKW